MPELVYQTWERITGKPWSAAAAGGFTDGSYSANIELQRRLLGGWNPFAPAPKPVAATAAAPAPTPAPSPAPAPRAATPSPGPIPVAPGLSAQQWEAVLALQKLLGEEDIRLREETAADVRRLQEAQLGANPADFVAYELYKRSLQEQGFTPQGKVRTDAEIQELVSATLGLEGGDIVGAGQFGVDIPTTQSISRSELRGLSPTDVGILSSFLRGGVETDGGQFQGVNPEDYFTELEEGLIPVLPTQRTQFEF